MTTSVIKVNEFTEYTLSDEETLAGQLLSDMQLKVFQNYRAEYARELVNLKFTPADVSGYLQQEAEMQGKLGLLTYILEAHEFAVRSIHETAVEEATLEDLPGETLSASTIFATYPQQ